MKKIWNIDYVDIPPIKNILNIGRQFDRVGTQMLAKKVEKICDFLKNN